jgi:hypothetical protein
MQGRFILAFAALLQVAIPVAVAARTPTHHRVQTESVCWVPDVEFPVPCDDEDDD